MHSPADTFNLSEEQRKRFYENGYLLLPDFFSLENAQLLLAEAHKLLSDIDLENHPKVY